MFNIRTTYSFAHSFKPTVINNENLIPNKINLRNKTNVVVPKHNLKLLWNSTYI